MPTTISPASSKLIPASVSCPADGDLANAASVNGAFQDLETATGAFKDLFYGKKLRPRYGISLADSTTAPVMTIKPLGSVLVTASGAWRVIDHNVTTSLDLLATLGAANFALKTRYYVYIGFHTTSGYQWQVTTVVPDGRLMYQSGSTDWAYVGTFLSDDNVNTDVWPCFEENGTHRFSSSIASLTLLNAGNAAVGTAVPVYSNASFGQIIPAYAKVLLLWLVATTNAGDQIDVSGESTMAQSFAFSLLTDEQKEVMLEIIAEDDTNVYYNWTAGGAGRGASIFAAGWRDGR